MMDIETAAQRVEPRAERMLRGLFAVCAGLAIVGSIFLSGVRGPDWLPATWASLCIAFYGFAGYRRAPDLAVTEEFADSLYYLGFLLTLVSLVLVLYRLSGSGSGVVQLSVVLPQFGLALATTIVGLLGRTVLILFRNVADETEQRAQHRMARAFDDFAQALERLGEEADAFRARTREQLEATVTQNQQQLDAALALSRRHLDAAGEAIGGLAKQAAPLIEAMAESARTLERTRAGLAENVGGFGGELGELRGAVTTTSSTLNALEQRTAALQRSLGQADEAVGRLTAGLSDDGVGGAGARPLAEQWSARIDELMSIRRALSAEADEAALALARFRRELAGGVRVLREEVER